MKKMKLLTKELQESYLQKVCYICKTIFEEKHVRNKKYRKVRNICHYTHMHICNLKYSVPKEIYTVFHNGSNYDNNFVTKSLAEKFEGQFTCLKENAGKYITFSVPVEKKIY